MVAEKGFQRKSSKSLMRLTTCVKMLHKNVDLFEIHKLSITKLTKTILLLEVRLTPAFSKLLEARLLSVILFWNNSFVIESKLQAQIYAGSFSFDI